MKKVNDFLAALGFLTIIPVTVKTDWNDKGKLLWFPVVGLVIGVILCTFDAVAGLVLNPAGRGLLDVVFLIIISGGLHLDGLSDSADGLFSHRTRERSLEIMKDSRLGVFGAVALIMVLFAKWAGISSISDAERCILLLLVPLYGRTAMLAGLAFGKAAKEEGMAASLFTGSEKGRIPFLILAVMIVPFLFDFGLGVVLNLIFIAVTCIWFYICRKGINGMTGDTIGGLCELVEAAICFTGCML